MTGEWQELSVAEVAAQSPNAMVTGPFGSSISSRFFQSRGVPVIRGSNLTDTVGARLKDEGLVFLTPDKAAEFSRSVARRGDLVFTCWGTIGQVGLIDHRARYDEYIISNKQMKLTPDPSRFDSLFLYYVFSSPAVSEEIKNQSIGSSVPGFNLGQLKAVRLRVPPLADQRAIARVLGALDDKIELNRKMNATLEAMARALFKSWFVDFDPVRAKAEGRAPSGMDAETAKLFPSEFVDSELGETPKGWRRTALSEAAELNPTRTLSKGALAPYVEMSSLPTSGHRPSEWPMREMGSGAKFQNGDTLLARITPCLENGKTGFVDFLGEGKVGWGSTEYIVIAPRPPVPSEWGYLLARDEAFRDFAKQKMEGSTGRQRVPAGALGQYLVTIPSEQVGARFGDLVRSWFQRMAHGHEESSTLARLRGELLPRLLSGELSVAQAARSVEEFA